MVESEKEYTVQLMGGDGPVDAMVYVQVRDWHAQGRRHRPCTVRIEWSGHTVEATADSVYHAFQDVRQKLEPSGRVPNCFGACPNVQTSGMCCDMGDGTMAYRTALNSPGTRFPLINIFDSEPGLQLGTVGEQKEWHRRFWKPASRDPSGS